MRVAKPTLLTACLHTATEYKKETLRSTIHQSLRFLRALVASREKR